MPEAVSRELSEFHKFVIPTAYGIHHRINRALLDLFERSFGHSCFFFYEYILDHPITILDGQIGGTPDLNTQNVLAPFLRRYAHNRGLMPKVDVKGEICKQFRAEDEPQPPKFIPITPTNLRTFWRDDALIPIDKTDVLSLCWRVWQSGDKTEKNGYKGTPSPAGVCRVEGERTSKELRGWLSQFKETEDDNLLGLQLREFALVVSPFLQADETQRVQIVSYSLSSQAIFWGQCLLLFPWSTDRPEANQQSNEELRFLRRLNKLMTQEISNVYAPVLTLLLNTVYERTLEKELDHNAATIRAMKPQRHLKQLLQRIAIGEWGFPTQSASRFKNVAVTFEPHMFNRSLSALGALCRTTASKWEATTSKLSFLEKGLLELWSERKSRAVTTKRTLRDTLLFSKYFVASPSLVQQVQKAVRLRHQKSKSGPNVVSALVIGGPGSGKDTMAKLIWLFSPGFRFGGIRTLNMAMFRPKELAVPLLLGLNANEGSTPDSIGPFQLDGVLLRAMRSHELPLNSTTQSRRTVGESTTAKGFTFILDELNSLDIDTQGALLRVLENAELTPLGGMNNPIQISERTTVIPTCASDILIIGIMNEDPHLIMKRQAMDRILQQSELFGTILGQTLHELLRSQRRLRDDLYYRLIRGGEIIMPTLTQRIEDIPILVYNTISRFNDLFPDNLKEVEVELKVYDLLMDPSLKWEGNLRELQTITRSIVMEAKARFEKNKKFDLTPPTRFIIRGTDARRALQVYQKPLAHAGSVG